MYAYGGNPQCRFRRYGLKPKPLEINLLDFKVKRSWLRLPPFPLGPGTQISDRWIPAQQKACSISANFQPTSRNIKNSVSDPHFLRIRIRAKTRSGSGGYPDLKHWWKPVPSRQQSSIRWMSGGSVVRNLGVRDYPTCINQFSKTHLCMKYIVCWSRFPCHNWIYSICVRKAFKNSLHYCGQFGPKDT